eukprot:117157-Prymnesium_polylepis.1
MSQGTVGSTNWQHASPCSSAGASAPNMAGGRAQAGGARDGREGAAGALRPPLRDQPGDHVPGSRLRCRLRVRLGLQASV